MGVEKIAHHIQESRRPLDVIYAIDTSGSMWGEKIQSVNNAMHELERALREEARKNPAAEVNIRVLTFGGDNAKWHLAQRTNVENFNYEDINDVGGMTPMGSAFALINEAVKNLPPRSYKPVIVLLSDGLPNDEYEQNLNDLVKSKRGANAVKIAIAIGQDADKDLLARFTTDSELVLSANNATYLKSLIRWTSTLVSVVSQHHTESTEAKGFATSIKAPAPNTMPTDDDF